MSYTRKIYLIKFITFTNERYDIIIIEILTVSTNSLEELTYIMLIRKSGTNHYVYAQQSNTLNVVFTNKLRMSKHLDIPHAEFCFVVLSRRNDQVFLLIKKKKTLRTMIKLSTKETRVTFQICRGKIIAQQIVSKYYTLFRIKTNRCPSYHERKCDDNNSFEPDQLSFGVVTSHRFLQLLVSRP